MIITPAIPQRLDPLAAPSFAGLTVDSPTLFVDNVNHKVGIGTIAPDYALHISGPSNTILKITNRDVTNGSSLLLEAISTNARKESQIHFSNIFQLYDDLALTRLFIDGAGNVGIGTTLFGTSAAGVLGLGLATAPTTAPSGVTQLYSSPLGGAGNARLGWFQEKVPYAGAAVPSTTKIPVDVNGVAYYLLATTVA